jgi:DNA invertase Pin-like site-specific DNA recombinase
MKRAFIYSRVSKMSQDFERQNVELKQYAEKNNIEVIGVFSEKISGANDTRPEMEKMINESQSKNIDLILVWEFSRIGRKAIDVQNKIADLHRINVEVYIHKLNFTTDPTGKNPLSTFLFQIMSSLAEMELTNIKDRLQSGRDHYKRNGGYLGRPKKTKQSIEQTKNYDTIVKYLAKGYKKNETAKLCEVSLNTVLKVKKHINEISKN